MSTSAEKPIPNLGTRQNPWVMLAKFAFVGALLALLVQKGFISLQSTRRAFLAWKILLATTTVMAINTVFGALRWHWLLRDQGIRIRFTRTLNLSFIGNFFNVALPGAVSGDFVKAYYVGLEAPGQRTRAFGSILFDRVAGLSALVFVSAGTLLWGAGAITSTTVSRAIEVSISLAALGAFGFFVYLFLVQERHDPLLRLLKYAESRMPRLGAIRRIYEALRHYHSHRATVLRVLAISIVIHLCVGWTCYQFALALGESQIGLRAVYWVVPIGLLVTAVPVMPAGVGTGHAAFLYLFHLIGSDRGADVFTLLALTNLLIGAVGGVAYLRFKRHQT